MAYSLVRPLVFAIDAEQAHRLTIRSLAIAPPWVLGTPPSDPRLAITVAGMRLANPVGLAAGFDKNAEAVPALAALGFGAVEIGTVTPLPQAGNPRPRLFRLVEDSGVINRMGFNNDGADAVRARLEKWAARGLLVGVNIGANKDSPDRIADYAAMARTMEPLARYLAVNVSSPNTPGLRDLQAAQALRPLLAAVMAERGETPVFLKVAPDLDEAGMAAIASVAVDAGVAAIIVANTTVSRPELRSSHRAQAGGLSGAPLAALASRQLAAMRRATGGAVPLVAAGGIASAEDAWQRIRAGASLVQLYTALAYEGPGLVRRIVRGLAERLDRSGAGSIAEMVGVDAG